MRLLLLVLLLAPLAASPQGSPAELSGAYFQPLEEEPGTTPVILALVAPGELEIREGDVYLGCQVRAEGNGFLWSLTLSCGEPPSILQRQWTWLPGGRVWTDVVAKGEGGTFQRTPAPPEPARPRTARKAPTVSPAPPPEDDEASVGPSSPWGEWRGAAGSVLLLQESGELSLDGHLAQGKLATCIHAQVEPPPEVPCLRFKDRAGKEVAFGLLEDFVWVEGRIRQAPDRELELFEGWRNGRYFRRPTPAVPPPASR